MLKTRILLVVIAVVAIAAIYMLPRSVVDNNAQEQNLGEVGSDEVADTLASNNHSFKENDSEVQNTLIKLKASLSDSENSEKKVIFADSLAKIYKSVGLLDSTAYYKELISKEMPSVENWVSTADAYYEAMGFAMDKEKISKMSLKAREFYEKVKGQKPSPDIEAKLAMTYVQGDNPMQGITMLRSILEKHPNNRTAIFNLGVLSVTSGQLDKAVERFQKLVELNASDQEAHFYLGYILSEQGKKEAALSEFNKVVELGGNSEIVASAQSYIEMLKN